MTQSVSFPDGTKDQMEILLKTALSGPELRRVQSILLGAQGINSSIIASIVGYSSVYVRKLWKKYRLEGKDGLLGEKRGAVRGKARLSLQEEENFLSPFFEKAKNSGILIVSEVHQAHKELLQKVNLHRSVTYNLLHRHGWRKIVPRPFHPKADFEKQREWKSAFPPGSQKGKEESKEEKITF